jgi:hypothetical protein
MKKYKNNTTIIINMSLLSLTKNQKDRLLERLPKLELSYETISHNKVYDKYNICLAVPTGKKIFLWFTFYKEYDVCYLLECNRDKQIINIIKLPFQSNTSLSLGTILYGTMIQNEDTRDYKIIVEDMLYYHGISTKHFKTYDIFHYLSLLFKEIETLKQKTHIYMCNVWETKLNNSDEKYPAVIDETNPHLIQYPIHHLQYRSSHEKMPYINVTIAKKMNIVTLHSESKQKEIYPRYLFKPFRMTMAKPQYKYRAIFQICADIQYDIYHLFAYGRDSKVTYYNLAYIPNYKVSVILNKIFRKIKENDNLDYIEESDDETDFQNTQEDKYVNLQKKILMECEFSRKFKKWVPIKIAPKHSKIVHINKL